MKLEQNSANFSSELYQRGQKVCVTKWDTTYGGANAFCAVKGKGDYFIGSDGKKYIDWNNGILCKVFGYGDKKMEKLMIDQIKSGVVHTSSVYLNEPVIEFKEAATNALKTFGDYVILPASSGNIADSMALRIALGNVRSKNPNAKVYYIIPFCGYSGADFHANGRCGLLDWCGLTTPKFSDIKFINPEVSDIAPFDPNTMVKAADVEKWFVDHVDSDQAVPVVLSECGQLGLGGFRQISSDWMRAVTAAAKKRGGYFICDCVQAFPLRTGAGLWGFERWVKSKDDAALPDLITTAKGLGDGMPIALVAMRREIAEKVDGKWFDTFAGNPIAAKVATEVLRRVQTPEIINNVQARGEQLRQGLTAIQKKYRKIVRGVIGSGLMSGLAVVPDKLLSIRQAAQDRGLLFAMGTDGTIRLAPHLDVTEKVVRQALRILRQAIADVKM